MGILYDKVMASQETKRQMFIKELLVLGVSEFQNQSVEELDYYVLRNLLAISRIRIETDSNKWF